MVSTNNNHLFLFLFAKVLIRLISNAATNCTNESATW